MVPDLELEWKVADGSVARLLGSATVSPSYEPGCPPSVGVEWCEEGD